MRLLTLAAVIAVPCFGQTIYSWEDDEGVHYTDDASQVPKKAKVQKEVATSSSKGSVLTPTTSPAPTAVAVAPPPATSSEYEWRDLFIAAHRRIQTVRKGIVALEATLPPRTECTPQPLALGANNTGQPLQTFCQVNPVHDQIRVQIGQQVVELRNAELDLEQLERRASMVGVPREWRRGW